ncbi:MAG TPA: bifunctional 5,10-methylenetetrahydrofolate dehydrogenase/5,10-methenyltetrahydrofolate cyclohydrolase [Candidatus Dormibacteraeota bacterium]|jgi:methylenetetrahydrofolate dehydrogenase (NADP+)/methenyltetrahydrofolate cyclohydrolase|nr:bifunctional 5,10-methylenetetrahydrofolate dehydrogenase/5,10-methenyltetrahydrofolate cyclohydrolase [Candidatus Dormibacteraeota bacterium]
MSLIDGRAIAAGLRRGVEAEARALAEAGMRPTLAIVVPTGDAATAAYVRSLTRAAAAIGIETRVADLEAPTGEEVGETLEALSANPVVHGVICQTPLPAGVGLHDVGARIAPWKDVDGANPVSLGRLAAGLDAFAPATAEAVLAILREQDVPLSGADAVVVGRSTVVGRPLSLLLLAENATVTVCHTRTLNLAEKTRRAGVLVAAAGRPGLIGAEHVRPGAVVIDVGTNPTDDGLVGDVDAEAVEPIAGALTPVPGGVGPVTTAVLLGHVVAAARRAL